jgi:hypothetical protein
MALVIKKASKKELEEMMQHVKRFDSVEFVKTLETFNKKDYIVYGANGNAAVCKAIRAIKTLHEGRIYVTRAISTKERIVARL